MPLALSYSFWDTHSTRSLVNSLTYSQTNHTQRSVTHHTAVLHCSVLTLLLSSVVSCKLGLLSAGELLQHRSEPVCRPQPCRGPCQELQVRSHTIRICDIFESGVRVKTNLIIVLELSMINFPSGHIMKKQLIMSFSPEQAFRV